MVWRHCGTKSGFYGRAEEDWCVVTVRTSAHIRISLERRKRSSLSTESVWVDELLLSTPAN